MIIAVPSKGRAGKVRTTQFLPSAVLYVPALEAEAYRQTSSARRVVAVPDRVRGITATRNWILKTCGDRRVVMIDDDVKDAGYIHLHERHTTRHKLPESVWLDEFRKLFEVTEQLSYRIWGVMTDGAPSTCYPYFPFRFRSYVTASCMGIVNDGKTLFDESYPVKEDYELCLRCLSEDGGIVQAQFLFWINSHWHDAGGCHDYRTQAIEADCIRRLRRAYPGLVYVDIRRANEYSLRIAA